MHHENRLLQAEALLDPLLRIRHAADPSQVRDRAVDGLPVAIEHPFPLVSLCRLRAYQLLTGFFNSAKGNNRLKRTAPPVLIDDCGKSRNGLFRTIRLMCPFVSASFA